MNIAQTVDNWNMPVVDYQIEMVMYLVDSFVQLAFQTAQMMNMQNIVFGAYKFANHPSVEYCTSIKTCGPFQILWDNYVMAYNDPTVMMQVWYPIVKVVIICSDLLFIFLLFAIPLGIQYSVYAIKWLTLLTQQEEEL